jgi:antitoxin (DNA-binding transcriptional repressor) of toxin-antitoxin stability system
MVKNTGYNIYEAKTRLSELVAKAKRGEKVILMNRGEPHDRSNPTAASGAKARIPQGERPAAYRMG